MGIFSLSQSILGDEKSGRKIAWGSHTIDCFLCEAANHCFRRAAASSPETLRRILGDICACLLLSTGPTT